jgi:serine/threonine protein kinase
MTLCGTDEWMAPETMMGLDYNQAADVFSFAIYLTEMICRAVRRLYCNASTKCRFWFSVGARATIT